MTDISESGIEAALAPCPFCGGPVRLTQSKTLGDRLFVIECERNSPCFGSGLGNYVVASQKAEAIAAWNRRHPPASREEGLREAAAEVRKWPGAEFLAPIILALIPTKPEAKEPSLSERVTELENALRPFAELADVFAATGADKIGGRDIGKALNAARAALQSKKPE